MRLNRYLFASLALALASLAFGPAQAQTDSVQPAVQNSTATFIGRVVTAAGSFAIEHKSAVIVQANASNTSDQAKVGDPVYLGDVVRTGADGRIGINFTDGTSFTLSSNARIVLDEFVYDPNGKSNSTFLRLTKGTFTFVAGNIAKTGDMKIDTPVATMGIRGTTPRVEMSDDGTVKFVTLIEEGKNKAAKTHGPRPALQPEQETHQKFNLNICRGC